MKKPEEILKFLDFWKQGGPARIPPKLGTNHPLPQTLQKARG